jgi:hypothetical protein
MPVVQGEVILMKRKLCNGNYVYFFEYVLNQIKYEVKVVHPIY